MGNLIAQRKNLFQQWNVLRPGQVIMLDQKLLACLLAFGVLLDRQIMPGDIGHDRVFVVSRLDLLQKSLGHSVQFGFSKFDRLLGLGDVRFIIGCQAGKFFAHPLDFVALCLGQIQAGTPVIAHRFGE